MTHRNFGIPDVTSRPASLGAQRMQTGSHSRAGQRDPSNVIELFPSAPRPVDPADADLGALAFSIAVFWSPCVLVGLGLVIYSLFF